MEQKSVQSKYYSTAIKHRFNRILIVAVIGLYILLRLSSFAQNDLWYDEIFSVLTVRFGWAEMFSAIVRDAVHPPLFYVLLKLWSIGDSSVWWLRAFPFLISILTLAPLFLLCRQLKFNVSELLIVFLTIAVNSYFLEYALDLRMYGLVQFFTLFSLWLFIKFQESSETEPSIVWFLAFFNLLLVYTHYFGWLIVGLEALYLLFQQRRRFFSFVVSSAVVLLCCAPWIWFVSQNAFNNEATGNLEWLTRPEWRDLLWFYATLNGHLPVPHTTFLNLAIFLSPVCFYLWRSVRQKTPNRFRYFPAFFAFAPVIIVFILSHILPKSIWGERYLIIAAVPYHLMFVRSAVALPEKRLRSVFVGLILIWSLSAAFFNFSQTPKKIRWSGIAEQIRTKKTDAKSVYVFDDWVATPLRFYLNEEKIPVIIEKRNNPKDIRETKYWMALHKPISREEFELPENLRGKKCRIFEKNVYFDTWQNTILLYVEDCD
jgi:hypothetical protein